MTFCAYAEFKLAYLFSDHLGLLVNFLPIGHIAQEVMALSSRERDLFSGVFEALFCSTPQDHLAGNETFHRLKQPG